MGANDRNDPLAATDGPTPRRHPWKLLLLGGVSLIGLVLVGFIFPDRLSDLGHGEDDPGNRLPPGVLADYVPEDSQAVLAVNMRQLQETAAGSQQLVPAVQLLIRRAGGRLHWIDLLGVDPLGDLDFLQISFAPAAGEEPLWLLRGRFDRSRFQLGPDKLQETTLDRFRVWEFTDPRAKLVTIIAPVGDMLVVSESRAGVQSALKQASNPRPLAVRDAKLREILTKADRRQTLWLAASLQRIGPITDIEDYWIKLLLRPLLAHAESVYGGIHCAEDTRTELHFQAATEEKAAQLEISLGNIRDIAREGGALLVRQKELLPLLRLLGAAEIHRDGTMILLSSRLAVDQTGR